jgi:hypothetical protein
MYHSQPTKTSLRITRLSSERKEKIQEIDPYMMVRENFIETLFGNFERF